jgi:hypothetical protein
MRIFLTLAFSILLITSCFEEGETIPMESLHGEWQGAAWLVKGKESGRDFSSVRFQFNADSTYISAFADQRSKGVYRTKGNKLYTTAKGEAEISVELEGVSADTINMRMNRQGDIENLILVRQQ